jgi:hypothetical protein
LQLGQTAPAVWQPVQVVQALVGLWIQAKPEGDIAGSKVFQGLARFVETVRQCEN